MPAEDRPVPSPRLHRAERRRRALAGLGPAERVVYSTGWVYTPADELDELGELPAHIGDVLAACPLGAFGIPRQDRP